MNYLASQSMAESVSGSNIYGRTCHFVAHRSLIKKVFFGFEGDGEGQLQLQMNASEQRQGLGFTLIFRTSLPDT